ncbi:MAG: MltA-interacting MipA family protein [Rhodobacteraceae bacterium]|nr:MltA-interacting MipA family protein [Paracoccaceae bacterium]
MNRFTPITPRLLAAGLGLSLAALTTAPARAQDDGNPDRKWGLILGGRVESEPTFEGSDENEIEALPTIILTYGRLQLGPDLIAVNLLTTDSYYGTIDLSYDGARDADDLVGFADIDDGLILGAELGYRSGDARVFLLLDRYFDGAEGTTASLGFEYEWDVSRRFSWSAGASITYADNNYMTGYFGVTPAQSASSGRAIHDASSGFQRVDINLTARYALTQNWFVYGELGLGQLLGDAADSPIVQDKTQSTFAFFFGYRF